MNNCFTDTSERENKPLTGSWWPLFRGFLKVIMSFNTTISRRQIISVLTRALAGGMCLGVSESRRDLVTM